MAVDAAGLASALGITVADADDNTDSENDAAGCYLMA